MPQFKDAPSQRLVFEFSESEWKKIREELGEILPQMTQLPQSISAERRQALILAVLRFLAEKPAIMEEIRVHFEKGQPMSRIRIMRPSRKNRDQAWFWTKEWQQMEREVEQNLVEGKYKDFDSMDELLADLESE